MTTQRHDGDTADYTNDVPNRPADYPQDAHPQEPRTEYPQDPQTGYPSQEQSRDDYSHQEQSRDDYSQGDRHAGERPHFGQPGDPAAATTQPLSHDEVAAATHRDEPVADQAMGAPLGVDAPFADAPNTSAPHRSAPSAATDAHGDTDRAASDSLFATDDLSGLRSRWDDVQAGFVDDPRACVQKADGLVSDVVDQLTDGFSHARSRLEEQWARGEEVSTEDLRLALTRYREFFQRLLAV